MKENELDDDSHQDSEDNSFETIIYSLCPAVPSDSFSEAQIHSNAGCTLGPPIWSSIPLSIRRTSIWHNAELKRNLPTRRVFWRNLVGEHFAKPSRSQLVCGMQPGVSGNPRVFDSNDPVDCIITVESLCRAKLTVQSSPRQILHRPFPTKSGSLLRESVFALELHERIRTALDSRDIVFMQGTTHSNDSASGNVFFTSGSDPLTSSKEFMIVSRTRRPKEPGVVPISGNLHFMALELLKAMHREKACCHEDYHDIESFLWVICYALFRHAINSSPGQTDLDDPDNVESYFSEAFGPMSMKKIIISRQGAQPADLLEVEDGRYISAPVARLLHRIRLLTLENSWANGCGDTKHLTHAVVYEELWTTMNQLEACHL